VLITPLHLSRGFVFNNDALGDEGKIIFLPFISKGFVLRIEIYVQTSRAANQIYSGGEFIIPINIPDDLPSVEIQVRGYMSRAAAK